MEFSARNTIKNSAWSSVSYIWPIIFSIFVTPVVVSGIGFKDYGIYIFINSIISILGLLDLGISTAVGKYLSEYYYKGDTEKMVKLIKTSSSIFFLIGLLGLTIFMFGSLIPVFFSKFTEYSIYIPSIIFAGLTFSISLFSSIYTITFNSLQRFDISSKIGIIIIFVQQILILIFVLLKFNINYIFGIQFIIAIIAFYYQRKYAIGILPVIKRNETFLFFDKEITLKCYKFGIITSINNLAISSLTYLDRLLIPFFLGPSSLTFYSLPGNIASKIPGVSNSISATLLPMASGLSGTGDLDRLKILYTRSFRLIGLFSLAMSTTIIIYGYDILKYWISDELANFSYKTLVILTITNFMLSMAVPLSNFLLGLGRLKILTINSIIMSVANAILLLLLIKKGIDGAALAYLISVLPVLFIFFYTEKYYLKLTSRKKFYLKFITGNIVTGSIVFIISKFIITNLVNSFFTMLIVCAFTVILYISIYVLLGFIDKEDYDSFLNFFKYYINKKNKNV